MNDFNKSLLINNINFLMKRKGLKIGDVEKQLGVSAGYFSRICKEGNTTLPGIDFLYKLGNIIDAPLDALITVDYSALTPDENRILEFINVLLNKTTSNIYLWKKQSDKEIESKVSNNSHPLIASVPSKNYTNDNPLGKYNSLFFPDDPDIEYERIYTLELDATTMLMFSILTDIEKTAKKYELYMIINNNLNTICCGTDAFNRSGAFNSVLKKLCSSIIEQDNHVKLTNEVRSILDDIIDRDKVDNMSPEEIAEIMESQNCPF